MARPGRKFLPMNTATPVGAFVVRHGLSRQTAAAVLACGASSITKWGAGHAEQPPARVLRLIQALDRLADAGCRVAGRTAA